MSESMNIRSANLSDLFDVTALWKECGLVREWNNPVLDFERKLQHSPDLFLVLTLNDSIIASVMGGYDGHRGTIYYLAVKPSYQRLGYASKLLDAIETKLKARGCPKVNLFVRAENSGVVAMYQQRGYEEQQITTLGKRLIAD